jgi:DNA-binding NarL/FixJ family response regulator
MNALIVDSNAAHRNALHCLLERQFPAMEIDEAGDADAASTQAALRQFDLIFMDLRLPKGNGLDLTRRIRRIQHGVVICVFTSHDILEYRQAAFLCGADHFLVKGDSTAAEIVALIDSLPCH